MPSAPTGLLRSLHLSVAARAAQYLASLNHTRVALQRWVDDVRAVVLQLDNVPRTSIAGQVPARADVSRFGVFGHSMGGVKHPARCSDGAGKTG